MFSTSGSVDIINMAHINFLVKVELACVQDPESSPKSALKTSDQHIKYYFITQSSTNYNNHLYSFSRNTTNVAHADFLQGNLHGLKISLAHTNFHWGALAWAPENHLGPTLIELYI